jgi:hypothetical protein
MFVYDVEMVSQSPDFLLQEKGLEMTLNSAKLGVQNRTNLFAFEQGIV